MKAGMRLIAAILCVLSLLVELSFDNTNSFVRVTTEAASSIAKHVVDDEVSRSSAPDRDPAQHDDDESRDATVIDASVGHAADVVADFVPFIDETINRAVISRAWHYRYIPRFALLRPPIFLA